MARCGDVVIPGVLIASGITPRKGKFIYCDTHGWQEAMRKLSAREAANLAVGLPIDHKPEYPTEPLFLCLALTMRERAEQHSED